MDQFRLLATIGKGNFAKVVLLESKSNNQLYAIKQLKKESLIQNNEVKGPKIENSVLRKAREHDHPFIAGLLGTFYSKERLFFILEYYPGGDLSYHIQRGQFDVARSRFYAAEVCMALKFMHENGFIHRSLQLDNILLTAEGHIKVIDFIASAEGIHDHYGLTTSFRGTIEFMAPEMLLDKPYGRAVDWWAFGIILYQMMTAQSPFNGRDQDDVYDAILTAEPPYPEYLPSDAVDLIRKLLVRKPEERLGYQKGAEEIMDQVLFNLIDWEALYKKEVTSPFRPTIKDRNDLSNFDTEITSTDPRLTPVKSALSPAEQEQFRDFPFSYT
ncbi:hypothetical protein JMJ35_003654 [Cladonia borealis]|uniref:Uncharacterized protein n=1 Tax=Cladonia borealis TaxID=184061 RepID=A0AA39R2Y7_9LECA|nr:hypothetical protein JMJ35_003654 [Cladonia borealis]